MTLRNAMRIGLLAASLTMAPGAAAGRADDASALVEAAQNGITLGMGKATLVRLPRAVADVFVANDKIADVRVASPTQINIFAVGPGETTVYATDRTGQVVYSAHVRVAQNIDSIKGMLGLAMPGATIEVTPLNGMVLLTGTVASPAEVEEASRLVQAFVGDKAVVVNKLRTATPMQVNLQVKIAEVSRDLIKEFGVNLLSRDTTGGFSFGISRGRNFGTIGDVDLSRFPQLDASGLFGLPANTLKLPFDPSTGQFLFGGTDFSFVPKGDATTTLNFAGRIAGLDLASALDLLEQDGVVTTLAEPNLTALSGETASFLAGGEVPVPTVSQNGTNIEYKPYGVGLAFTPFVLDGGRISLRVRPEVSELTDAGSIRINGFIIPGLSTRRAETTIELGSGQSFMIAGLLRNRTGTSSEKTPLLGDLPVLGALFKSDRYQRNETELVIVITPYLVKPVSAGQIKLPTDGYQAPTDLQRWLLGRTFSGKSGAGTRPQPGTAAPAGDKRQLGTAAPAGDKPLPGTAAPAPGFNLDEEPRR